MHPEIRKFPSHEFYADKLEDAPGVIEREKPGILEVVTKDLQVKPSVFFDLKFANESTHQTSKQNEPEAKFIVALLQILADNLRKNPGCTDRNLGEKIGIISPYKS
jgi:superfamily I DNA and/or RNA helicase